MADAGLPTGDAPAPVEHLNIKVTDNNNEVFFKIKRSTQLKKLMDAFCERQGKQISTVRFLFDGTRVRPEDTPDTVCLPLHHAHLDHWANSCFLPRFSWRWPTAIPWKFTRSRSVVRRPIRSFCFTCHFLFSFILRIFLRHTGAMVFWPGRALAGTGSPTGLT